MNITEFYRQICSSLFCFVYVYSRSGHYVELVGGSIRLPAKSTHLSKAYPSQQSLPAPISRKSINLSKASIMDSCSHDMAQVNRLVVMVYMYAWGMLPPRQHPTWVYEQECGSLWEAFGFVQAFECPYWQVTSCWFWISLDP